MNECRKILVVDDEPLVLDLIRDLLESPDRVITVVGSGAEALLELKQRPYTVLLSDMKMPGMSGLELSRQVRRDYPELAIVLMTGYAENFTILDAIRAGADECIYKPLKQNLLLTVIEQAILRRTVQREFTPGRNTDGTCE